MLQDALRFELKTLWLQIKRSTNWAIHPKICFWKGSNLQLFDFESNASTYSATKANPLPSQARSHNGNALVCKTNYKGSSPFLALLRQNGPVAQLVERTPDKGKVGSSTLPRFTKKADEQLPTLFRKKKKSKFLWTIL